MPTDYFHTCNQLKDTLIKIKKSNGIFAETLSGSAFKNRIITQVLLNKKDIDSSIFDMILKQDNNKGYN